MPTNPKIHGVPKSVLHQLNEFSNGGFIVFMYDESGIPRTMGTFDSPANALGMQNFIHTWSDAIHTFSVENLASIIEESHKAETDDGSDIVE